ncbi:MAG: hypothetical protein WA294_20070 [Acidobacteriaceae bacterium]
MPFRFRAFHIYSCATPPDADSAIRKRVSVEEIVMRSDWFCPPPSASALRLFALLAVVAVAGPVRAQTGSFAAQSLSLGSVAVNTATPATATLTFIFAASGTIAAPAVLTQGAPDLDFTDALTGTCDTNGTGHVYNAGDSCTVVVNFTPKLAGGRNGAAVISASGGAILATEYLVGTGTGPQVNFYPGKEITIQIGENPSAVAVDGRGNVFFTNEGDVTEEALSNGQYTQITIASFESTYGIGIDGAGNIFVACPFVHEVVKLTPGTGGYTQSVVVSSSQIVPLGLAVDGAGDVFFVDELNNQVLEETPSAGGYTQSTIPTTGLVDLLGDGRVSLYHVGGGIAVDAAGNLYITTGNTLQSDASNASDPGVIRETPSGSTYVQSTVATVGSISGPIGIAVDPAGAVYISNTATTDTGNYFVAKETPSAGGYVETTVPTGPLINPQLIAVDNGGNLYIANLGQGNVLKEDYSHPPALTFSSVPNGSTSGPETATVNNVGNSPLTFPALNAGNNPSISTYFVLDSTVDSACPLVTPESASGALGPGASCLLSVTYQPEAPASGFVSGMLNLTDNNLNAPAYVTQSIQLGNQPLSGQPPVGKLGSAVDSVTGSTTVGISDSVEISGWVADPVDGAPLSNVAVYIDNNLVGKPALGLPRANVAAKTGNPAWVNSGFQLLYAASALSLGTHQATVVATDSGGRSTTFGPASFTVAATAGASPPIGAIAPPADSVTGSNTVGQSDLVKISGWAADALDGAPLSNVTVYIDGKSAGTPTLGIARNDVAAFYQNAAYTNSGYQILDSASDLSLGKHSATVVATDSAGRSTTFGPVAFKVATVAGAGPPFGTLARAVGLASGTSTISSSDSLWITGWVADPTDGAPLSNVAVYIDGVSVGTPTLGIRRLDVASSLHNAAYTNSGYQMQYPVAGLSAGLHSVMVVAIDSIGNSTTLGARSFTVE